ncbi:hypothetical protein DC080_02410 [Ignatzschineria cameli]|nr:hypothetical protein DC080_02410 [Ignatzschineria cameli]
MKDINVMHLFIIFLLFTYKAFRLINNVDSYFSDGFNYRINYRINYKINDKLNAKSGDYMPIICRLHIDR